ncbi:MAG: hypothetical protein CO001_02520 [Candidatus Portnoybacteria bacterium CG_4_8_14_3_um_filter_40_10]|uniref:Uncharacterized protein n=3 Tax=Candidatus Portnoyibacteriota TaxID=1817913 RepID=A0A2M7II67_9BACT|nr:MAG: hypothetical protein COT41_01105 [Candidatus Portnoybacteria bacterium CG08_land_8_20_14_0_20_40_83]PIW76220.1 MAG: hypothetical protein CO001_02520 [Candidatus Portnoybacteria bacterium CG_4_8_14_3_um_filter_40_10]PIY74651.1 MAG: hypothetical protein COY85_02560 [Candidatus Portnoybacteria bacterium CG_4_10_14_0_8_um_filter_40_50]PJA64470.1 MAG: hypothetical protein CO159_02935 [Candidatus Portnoybacteria bacterium CG_4_9_14_3_um_filter_40_10]
MRVGEGHIANLRHVVLPSSLTRIHSFTLGFSPRLPVSVFGTVLLFLTLEVFLGSSFARIGRVKTTYSQFRKLF